MAQNTINKLEEAFSLGCTDLEATLYANIAPATLYKYQDNNKEFIERKTQLKQAPILLARKSVLAALRKNPELALKFLERKKKDEFSLRKENELTVINPIPILGGQSITSTKK